MSWQDEEKGRLFEDYRTGKVSIEEFVKRRAALEHDRNDEPRTAPVVPATPVREAQRVKSRTFSLNKNLSLGVMVMLLAVGACVLGYMLFRLHAQGGLPSFDINVEFLVLIALLGLIPAYIAEKKGQSFIVWWLLGSLLFIVVLPAALLIKTDAKVLERQKIANGYKKCPDCAELVKEDAVVCRHCGKHFA